ncbi:hypothetical protein BY458DRAFT_486665 [Sporodiniella umbellata]|nr:hypothetical protein BY458DRAFT_486665 [Sporodiniella umbellata]
MSTGFLTEKAELLVLATLIITAGSYDSWAVNVIDINVALINIRYRNFTSRSKFSSYTILTVIESNVRNSNRFYNFFSTSFFKLVNSKSMAIATDGFSTGNFNNTAIDSKTITVDCDIRILKYSIRRGCI